MKRKTILREIRQDIANGVYGKAGEKFITLRALAQKYQISVVTAKRIFDELSAEKLILKTGNAYYLIYDIIERRTALFQRRRSIGVIGFYMPRLENRYYSSIAQSVKKRLQKYGYRLFIMTPMSETNDLIESLETFQKAGCDGVIVTGEHKKVLEAQYRKFAMPIIFISQDVVNDKYDYVMVENYAAGRKVAKLLYQCGYDKLIALVPNQDSWDSERINGFVDYLYEKNYPFDREADVICISENSGMIHCLSVLLANNVNKTLGIFAYHDLLAESLWLACHKKGVDIPNTVGIVGFDNLYLDSESRFTTIAYSIVDIGNIAVDTLIARIGGDNSPADKHVVPFYLYHKGSTKVLNGGRND